MKFSYSLLMLVFLNLSASCGTQTHANTASVVDNETTGLDTYKKSCGGPGGSQTVKLVHDYSVKNFPQIEYSFPLDKILITSGFECRYGFFHGGIDLAGLTDSPISAIADGEVRFSGFKSNTGNTVIVFHPQSGIESMYGHASKNLVKKGDRISRGQTIQFLGNTGQSTGAHLHLQLSYDGALINPCAIFNCSK